MLTTLTRNWRILILKGILLILFALFAFFNPTLTATTLVMWFAALIILDGILTIIAAIVSWDERTNNWILIAEGLVSLVMGIVLLVVPQVTLFFISIAIAMWFIFIGISRVFSGYRLRKEIKGEGWVILGGVVAIILGLLIFVNPTLGIGSLMYLIGITALLVGIALIFIGFKFKKGHQLIKEKIDSIKEQHQGS
ncbi:HdeD family acid-resistance protein [Robertkochia solimangrovi]|uniref:HdeD family acid-resistance protein n=1 Tax=Robertkochia solimangrovi TaxID=2213046 RepID=UPI00117F80C3|nr:HdeD family acid-resistance protein [Robertkochia solimangrovi]TRZ41952.1 hypothetical protein DMZ48_15040 [Robertkochia solimangrovi]